MIFLRLSFLQEEECAFNLFNTHIQYAVKNHAMTHHVLIVLVETLTSNLYTEVYTAFEIKCAQYKHLGAFL